MAKVLVELPPMMPVFIYDEDNSKHDKFIIGTRIADTPNPVLFLYGSEEPKVMDEEYFDTEEGEALQRERALEMQGEKERASKY